MLKTSLLLLICITTASCVTLKEKAIEWGLSNACDYVFGGSSVADKPVDKDGGGNDNDR